MKADNNYGRIKTDETLRETVCHGSDEYPFKYYKEDIWPVSYTHLTLPTKRT